MDIEEEKIEKKEKERKEEKRKEGFHSKEKFELNFQSNSYIYHGLMIIFKIILIMAGGDNYL